MLEILVNLHISHEGILLVIRLDIRAKINLSHFWTFADRATLPFLVINPVAVNKGEKIPGHN